MRAHMFNDPFSGTTQVSQSYKGKTNLDFTETRDSEWQWHQLRSMQVRTAFQADNHARTPPLSLLTSHMPFLPPNQQCQSTEGKLTIKYCTNSWLLLFHPPSAIDGIGTACFMPALNASTILSIQHVCYTMTVNQCIIPSA